LECAAVRKRQLGWQIKNCMYFYSYNHYYQWRSK